MSSELTSPISLDLRINSQKRQQDVFINTLEAVAETGRFLPISYYNDYWSILLTTILPIACLGC